MESELQTCAYCQTTTLIGGRRNDDDKFHCPHCNEWRPCWPESEATRTTREQADEVARRA